MNDKSRDCLVKIAIECDKIIERKQRFNITEELFVMDGGYADMLLMPLAQIGELSVHVDDEVRKSIMPLSVWRQIRNFRNIIVHSYGTINRQWAYETVESDVPDLRRAILANEEARDAYEHEIDMMKQEQTEGTKL